MKRIWLVMALIIPCFFYAHSKSWSTETDINALSEEIKTLKDKIKKLEKIKDKVQKLEKKLAKAQEAQKKENPITSLQDEIKGLKSKIEAKDTKIGGALRINYSIQDSDDQKKTKKGNFDFDIFRLNLDTEISKVLFSAEYRWYSYMDAIHHGWLGYNFNENCQAQVGITQVPFGILPYASHNWWFGIPYYLGLEDDYDLGFKLNYKTEDLQGTMAFFKNAEWGNPSKLERYSYDLVTVDKQQNEESNQVNLRLAYNLEHCNTGKTELGISLQLGQIYNNLTDSLGNHWAAAIHSNTDYGPWNLMLEAIRYEKHPDNPSGLDDHTVLMGALKDSHVVASEGFVYIAGLSYNLPVDWGPVDSLNFYNDYSILVKDENDFKNSQLNTLGCLIDANPVYTYLDLIFGKNALYLSDGNDAYGPARESDDKWHTRFNINIGYYF